ncbi:hypothetical protein Y590_24055 [Methylobacterium sp. AMS5]|nr:hypothetical protein Y590_24055 [Methylobacterium sp. AMS5]
MPALHSAGWNGIGQIEAESCPDCNGTGKVIAGIGGG